MRERIGHAELGVGNHAGENEPHEHVDHRADGQPAENPDRQVSLRIAGLFGGGRDRVEPDIRKKDDGRALVDPGEPIGRKRRVVGGVEVGRADGDEERERDQLDDHHDVVGARAFLRAAQEHPRDQHHDPERREVHEDRHPGDVRGRIEQAADLGVRAEERGAIAGRQPHRQREADAAQQRRKVVAPGDGDGDVADRVLEHRSQPMIHATSSPSVAYVYA